MMKMLMIVMPRDEAEFVLNALIFDGYTATFMESRGGMLRQPQLTLFTAVNAKEVDKVMGIIQDNCRTRVQVQEAGEGDGASLGPIPVTTELGGAVVFIWSIDQIQTF